MAPTPRLLRTLAFSTVVLLSPSRPTAAAEGPPPFTGHLTEVDGVQVILSVKHPKQVNRDLEKLIAGAPEAIVLRLALGSTTRYGYPEYSDFAADANFGVALLEFSGANLKATPPVFVGFAKLKENGKVWTLLRQNHLTLQKRGDWVLIAKDEAALGHLRSPDAVIAYLEKPQTEDFRLWGRASPALLDGLREMVLPPFKAKLAHYSPEKQKAALAYFDAFYSLLRQLHSVEVSLTCTATALEITDSVQFRPDSPIGIFLSYPPGPPPAAAQYLSADALGSFVTQANPKAYRDLANSIFDTLIAVDYPPLAEKLKQLKTTYSALAAAIDGSTAGVFDLGLRKVNGRDQLAPQYFLVMCGHVSPELARDYFKRSQSMNKPFGKFSMAGFAGGAFENHSTYVENAASVDGVAFDSFTTANTFNGKELSRMTQYAGVANGDLVLADSEATLKARLPALRAKTEPASGIPAAARPGEYGRITLSGGRLVDLLAEAAKVNRNDPDVAAQLGDLKAGYAVAGPLTWSITNGEARAAVTFSMPYKFISASVHLGIYMSSQNLNLMQLLSPNVPAAPRHYRPRPRPAPMPPSEPASKPSPAPTL